jgi:hypothetical protein
MRLSSMNQRGFSIGQVLLVFTVLGLIGGVGYYVSQRQNEPAITNYQECVAAGNPIMESYPEQCAADGQTFTNNLSSGNKAEDTTANGLIVDVSDKELQISSSADVSKLEGFVPSSFLQYAQDEMKGNQPDEAGCVRAWVIRRVSDVNIAGSVGSQTDEGTNEGACMGGAAAFWYIQDGQWKLYATQMMDACSVIAKTTIYSEFIPECFKSADDPDTVLQNPNGSLTKAQ